MDKEKLDAIVKRHASWLLDPNKGQRADLQRADLQGAYLQRADLQGADLQHADLQRADLQGAYLQGADLQHADLDFSAWPLWCGSLGAKAGDRLVAQLLFHVARLDVSEASKWAQEAIKAVLPYADKFCKYRSDVTVIADEEDTDADSK